jgi:large subunit ribosomal protein L7/L12
MAEITREQVIDYLSNLSVLDIAALTEELEEKWGVSAAPVAVAGAAMAGGDAGAAEEEEKTEFDVELTSIGDKKINVIKAIRELTSLGLKEAKEVVDNAPKMVKEAVSKEEAEEAKKKLEDAGATVTLK